MNTIVTARFTRKPLPRPSRPFLRPLRLERLDDALGRQGDEKLPILSSFTPLEELEKHFSNKIAAIDIEQIAVQAAQEALDRHRGKV
jgi:hypothetical protein